MIPPFCICGSADVIAVAPGTASDAARFAGVVEIAASDIASTRAYCLDHWRASWTAVPERMPEDETGTAGQIDWIAQTSALDRRAGAEAMLRAGFVGSAAAGVV